MFNRSLYAKYQALSPIYQGWKTNHLPMLYTLYQSCGVDNDLMEVALDSYKHEKDLYELTDVTYPKTELDDVYIAAANQYLVDIHTYGLDVTLAKHLDTKHDAIHSQLYHGFVRLAYGKQSGDDLLAAQAMAYYDAIADPIALSGKTVESADFQSSFDALRDGFQSITMKDDITMTMDKFHVLLTKEDIHQNLFVDRMIHHNPEEWLRFLLQHYLSTTNDHTLHSIIAFHGIMMMEELLVQHGELLAQWMMSSQLLMLLDDSNTPIQDPTIVAWDTMLANIHLIGDANRTMLLYALYEIQQRYDLKECQIIASYLYLG